MSKYVLTHTPVTVVSGEFTYIGRTVASLREEGVPERDILAGVKSALKDMVDGEAERRRAMVSTSGAGQAMEYQQAQVEAFDAMEAAAAGRPLDPASYPMLAASIGIDLDPSTGALATDVLGVARSVKRAFDVWRNFGAAVRLSRLAGKAAIDAAPSVEAAVAAADAVRWPGSI